MRLIFVRHAEPDYSVDSLTEKGRIEAELLSRRLCRLDVKAFYCSPLGRARDTAAYTLRRMGRTAEIKPWLAEFRGRCPDQETGGQRIPWDYPPRRYAGHPRLLDCETWTEESLVRGGTVKAIWQETKDGLDAVLREHGYVRDGMIYRCADNKPDTLVFFCHYGVATAMLAYLIGIPPVPLWQGFCMQPSAVTEVITEERVKGEVWWRCMRYGDLSHLDAADEPWSTAGLFAECYDGRDTTNPIEWSRPKAEEKKLFIE